MSVNKIILVGNLGRDPEVRATPSGLSVCNFSLATTERYQGRDGQNHEQTEWHNIVVWGKQAELCGQYLKKGRQIYVEGRITNREYEARDGSGKRQRTEIVAQRVQFLGGRPAAGADDGLADFNSGAETLPPADDDDIPFIADADRSPERRFRI
jgi:single-strand DNA-binding protein